MARPGGVVTAYKIALDTALNKFKVPTQGKYLVIADTSSSGVTVDIALQSNTPNSFETDLQKNATLELSTGFDQFYITAAAQAGAWVRIVVSDGTYKVDNKSSGSIVQSITDTVNMSDATTHTDLTTLITDVNQIDTDVVAIKTALETDGSVKPPIVNVGAHFAEMWDAAGVTQLVAPASNTNGLIIRTGYLSGSGGSGFIRVGATAPATYNDATVMPILGAITGVELTKVIKLPAGYGVWATANATGYLAGITYDLL